MPTIAGISGNQYQRPDYDISVYQYATTSYEGTGRMRLRMVIQPQNKQDITHVLRYARFQGISVAIRTCGHQYSGASSTSGPNIQLDLKSIFKNNDDLRYFEKKKRHMFTQVSAGLWETSADFSAPTMHLYPTNSALMSVLVATFRPMDMDS